MLMLQGISDCLSSPKKSSIVCVTHISHFNANVDLYMKAWVKEGQASHNIGPISSLMSLTQ